ncbi:hypothetical protein N9966_00090 [bacterium]|nr:hypothetical protein [bacterium]
MLKIKLIKRDNRTDVNPPSQIDRGDLSYVSVAANNIMIPFSEQTKNNGYSELVNQLYLEEKNKNTNNQIDNEKLKFKASNYDAPSFLDEMITDPQISFYFYNTSASTFGNDYQSAGFTNTEINEGRNNLVNSFYRLDFYDSNNQREQNFLFSEFLNVNTNTIPSFPFNNIFYRKEDDNFVKENSFVELYFEVLFFNAKTGTIKSLMNSPSSQVLSLSQYNANPEWRFAKIKLLNPYFNEPNVGSLNKIFRIEPINANNDNEIRFTELIIE